VVACSRDVSRRADQLIGEVFVDPPGLALGCPGRNHPPPPSTSGGKRVGLLAYDAIASVNKLSSVRVRRCFELERAESTWIGFYDDYHCAEGMKPCA
jgi:hypothetical protein